MIIQIIYGSVENEYLYSELSEYPKLYLNIKNSIKNRNNMTYYTNNLDIFRWCGFFKEAYPGFVELIKTEIKKNDVVEILNLHAISDPKCSTISEWKKWIVSEYFTYKKKLDIENMTISDEIKDYILRFSDFYYSNYNSLKLKEEFISNILHDNGDEIRKDEVSIVLIIDNFNFHLKDIFCEFLNRKKIKIASEDYYFTTIPSETRFAKQALLSLSSLNFKSNWNVSTLSEIKNKFREKSIEYKSKISEIKDLNLIKNTVYIVNYLEIDELLHTDNLKVAGEILEKIETELERIASIIDEVLKNSKKIGIYVVTDHGSIKTYDKSPKIDNQVINNLGKNQGEIMLEIQQKDIEKNRENLEKYGYIVDKEKFLLDKNYYIAKQGIYFKEINGEKYLHGGISPDEICIPFLKLRNYRE